MKSSRPCGLRLEEGFSHGGWSARRWAWQQGRPGAVDAQPIGSMGEAGLQSCIRRSNAPPKLPAPITDKIIELKQAKPHVRHQTDQPGIAPVFLSAGQPGDRAPAVARGRVDDRKRHRPRSGTWSGPGSLSGPRPIRCGRRTSSRSGWAGVTRISSPSWMITRGSSWGRICSAAPRRRR